LSATVEIVRMSGFKPERLQITR